MFDTREYIFHTILHQVGRLLSVLYGITQKKKIYNKKIININAE